MSEDWADYDTGLFCRHWGDPVDCDRLCARCGHGCVVHSVTDQGTYCTEADCDYESWVEDDDH
jgi:hypothetical protein